jgi:hypothetical protein
LILILPWKARPEGRNRGDDEEAMPLNPIPASARMTKLPDGQISEFSVQTPSEKYFA